MALFYRTNAQSRMLEDMLLRAGVPYRIVGGTRFFDRAEIRDVMAYLTLAVNPADDLAAKRVINVPKRGIGKTTVERIEGLQRAFGITFLEACEQAVTEDDLRAATRNALAAFVSLIKEAGTWSGDLRQVISTIVDRAGLVEALLAEGTDEAKSRVENIQEFMGVVQEFQETHEDDDALYAAPAVGEGAQVAAVPGEAVVADSAAEGGVAGEGLFAEIGRAHV